MQAISGAPYTLTLDFLQDGEFVAPDDGSVTYTLYDNAGAAISGQVDQAVTMDEDNPARAHVTIASGQHTVAGGKSFEQRTLRVKYKYLGKDFILEEWYYVTALLNYRVTPADVIVLLGIKEGEVLFGEIDLVQAYFKVADTLGSSVLAAALSSGGIKQIKVNEAIKITAALDLSTVIELKAFRKFGNELSYARFEKINFDGIRESLKSALQAALSVAAGTTTTSPTLLLVTNPVNPITG